MDGSITLRKDGRYMGRLYIDNKQKCVYGKTKSEVQSKLKELQKRKKQYLESKDYYKMTLYDFALNYCECFKKPIMKESSYRLTLYKVDRWKDNKLFTKKLVNITHFDLDYFFKNYDKKNLSYLIIKETFAKAKEIGIISINPMALISKRTVDSIEERKKIINPENEIYSAEQINTLKNYLEECNYSVWVLFETLLCSGIRIGEALALQKKDLDFTNKNVKIYKSYAASVGKLTTTKTRKGTRIAPLMGNVVNTLRLYTVDMNDEDFIFDQEYYALETLCISLTKKLGFKVKLHKFRKTFISICQFELKIPSSVVAQWVGHANVTTTQDVYSYITTNQSKDVVENNTFDTYLTHKSQEIE